MPNWWCQNCPLIAQFYSFMKNVSQDINFTFSHKLNFNAKVFILTWLCHLLFWRRGYREDLMFFCCCSSSDCILWKDFHSSYDLYSHWKNLYHLLVIWFIFSLENLYHLAHRIIYIPTKGICIILLIEWFIFPHMIYILIGRICIICDRPQTEWPLVIEIN